MARDDEDEGNDLPPIGEGTLDFLEQAKKGKPRNFLLICKGPKVKYLLVKKKPVKKGEITDAKKLGYKGDSYVGVITGSGMQLVFNLAISDGYEAEPCPDKKLKDFLADHADFKCQPSFAIVAAPPEVPFEEEELNHPLVKRFLGLGEKISQVLDANASFESEIKQSTSSIKALLQESDFSNAERQIVALESRLNEILSGGSTAPGTESNSSTATEQPSADANAALKQKLQDALNKLVPQLKQAVATCPEKKVELLTPVAAIKQQLESGQLQAAREGIISVGSLLKSVLSGAGKAASTSSSETSQGNEQREYEAKLAEVMPKYERALKEMLGDPSKYRTVMAYVQENANAGVFGNAMKALDRLSTALDQAIALGNKGSADSNASNEQREYESKLAEVVPKYDRAIKEMLGDTGRYRAVMDLIRENAEKGAFGNALNALNRLSQALDQAISEGKKETDVIPENVIRDRSKFLMSHWQTALDVAYSEVAKIKTPINDKVPDEEPNELVDAITSMLDDLCDDFNDAIFSTQFATGANVTPLEEAKIAIQTFRNSMNSHELMLLLDRAKAELGVDINVKSKLLEALDALDARLSS